MVDVKMVDVKMMDVKMVDVKMMDVKMVCVKMMDVKMMDVKMVLVNSGGATPCRGLWFGWFVLGPGLAPGPGECDSPRGGVGACDSPLRGVGATTCEVRYRARRYRSPRQRFFDHAPGAGVRGDSRPAPDPPSSGGLGT
jgi:hypothetical protein